MAGRTTIHWGGKAIIYISFVIIYTIDKLTALITFYTPSSGNKIPEMDEVSESLSQKIMISQGKLQCYDFFLTRFLLYFSNHSGTHQWPDSRKVSGQWLDGHLHGKVYFSWPNGATFDGTCHMGKKQGRGIHTYADGRVFTGNFENGKENGFGTLVYPDSVKYRGQFVDGVKQGYGIQLWKTRTYDGEWYVPITLFFAIASW
jgi:hypothetical protein